MDALDKMRADLMDFVSDEKPLDKHMALEINQVLLWLGGRLMAEVTAKKRGAPRADKTTADAELLRCLVNEHHATVNEATWAI